jgi:anti-sigma B factor antagonist
LTTAPSGFTVSIVSPLVAAIFFFVTTECSILTGVFDGFSWIRCEGKGSFLNSPAVKAFGIERIAAGDTCLVVDLEACTGMDSTFMGTLAGMATRLSAQDGAALQIANAGDRNRHSLEDLGLDFLIEIDPENAIWRSNIDTVRANLKPPNPPGVQAPLQQAMHVLEAHQVLADTNEKNLRSFSTVVTILETELETKRKLAESPEDK